MSTTRTRQFATALIVLVTLVVNGAANALPINQSTAAISDRFHVFVIPAGYVFSIWGVIYLGLIAFTVYQWRFGTDPVVERIGWLPAVSGIFNTVWLLLFQYEVFVLTVPLMLALLVTLIAIHLRLWSVRRELTTGSRWAIRIPFSIYLGWITVATIANIAQTLSALGFDGFGIRPELIASVVLLLGLAIAARFTWEFRDAAYGFVIVWAYAGIVAKESSAFLVPWVAGAGALLIAGLAVWSIANGRPAFSPRPSR